MPVAVKIQIGTKSSPILQSVMGNPSPKPIFSLVGQTNLWNLSQSCTIRLSWTTLVMSVSLEHVLKRIRLFHRIASIDSFTTTVAQSKQRLFLLKKLLLRMM